MSRNSISMPLIQWLLAASLLVPVPASAQTCSCGAATLPGLQEIGIAQAREWRIGLSYEHNDVSALVAGTRRLEPEGRRQVTRAGVLTLSRGISQRFSVTVMLTLLEKERRVTDLLRVRAPGDAVLLLNLNLHPQRSYPQKELYLGLGVKSPSGANDLRHNGLLISTDMQPGSGAWDGIFTAFGATEVLPPLPARLFVALTYQLTGQSQRFASSDMLYRFGSDFSGILGGGYVFSSGWELTIGGRYRWRTPDQFDGGDVPNTGGQWLLLEPGLYRGFDGGVSLGLSGKVPLYEDLNGVIQFSTRYTINLSASYSFIP